MSLSVPHFFFFLFSLNPQQQLRGGSRSNSTALYPLCFCTSLPLNQHTATTVTPRQVALSQRSRPRGAVSKPLTAPVQRRTACRLYTSQSGPCTPAPCILGSPPQPELESERRGRWGGGGLVKVRDSSVSSPLSSSGQTKGRPSSGEGPASGFFSLDSP